MNRRLFFGGVAAVLGGLLPVAAAARQRDDAPLLQAMLDRGEPVIGRRFELASRVVVPSGAVIMNCDITTRNGAHLYGRNVRDVVLSPNVFRPT